MFEIYKRHNPVFVLSEIKQLAQIFTDTLGFNNSSLPALGVEIVDISQTVCINQNNQFIVGSKLREEDVISVLKKNPTLKRLRNAQEPTSLLIEDLLKTMVPLLSIDSYIFIGEELPVRGLVELMPKATRSSKKPLIVFNAIKKLEYQLGRTEYAGMDHPALWIGESQTSAMEGVEAFFSMSPQLKLEVGLNRYKTLESFGSFSVGLVRF